MASFVTGWLNIGLWTVALSPQIIKNYRTKTVDALSPFFVVQW
jgi:uncharacterized protein with PQ loop repeat